MRKILLLKIVSNSKTENIEKLVKFGFLKAFQKRAGFFKKIYNSEWLKKNIVLSNIQIFG